MAGQGDGSDIDWAPYHNRGEAACYLFRLVDRILGPDVGVVWHAWGAAIVLRKPILDNFGFGHSAIFQWHPAGHGPLPPAVPPTNAVPATNFFTDFFGNHEHEISFAFDVLAIVVTTAIAIPAAAAASTAIATVTLVALAGAILCAILDGTYLALRYLLGGSVERKAAAEYWDDTEKSPEVAALSVVGLVLTLPDLFMNGAATVQKIPKVLEELKGKPAAIAAKFAPQIAAEQADAARLGKDAAKLSAASERAAALARESQHADALSRARMMALASNMGARAEKIAKSAGEAYARGEKLQATLHTRIMHEMAAESCKLAAEQSSVIAGGPVGIGYGIRDAPDKIDWVSRHMLPPDAAVSYQFNCNPGCFIMTVGTSHQSRV